MCRLPGHAHTSQWNTPTERNLRQLFESLQIMDFLLHYLTFHFKDTLKFSWNDSNVSSIAAYASPSPVTPSGAASHAKSNPVENTIMHEDNVMGEI